jgi:diguanylate cyclase (GGDEF)-like protein
MLRPGGAEADRMAMSRLSHSDLAAVLLAQRRRVAELEAEESISSGHDALTGLLDLRGFCLQLDIELSRSRRHGRPLALALLDIEGFGAMNERHGVEAADSALRAVGDVLSRFLRAYDVACRTIGDEFALLLPETDPTGARKCVERIQLELGVLDCGPLSGLSASSGVTSFTGRESAMQLFAAAGRSLDRARAGIVGIAPTLEMGDEALLSDMDAEVDERGDERPAEPEAA